MEIKILKNGKAKIKAPNGVRDTRNGMVFSEVVVSQNEVQFFAEA